MCDYYTTKNKERVYCVNKAICEVDVKGLAPMDDFMANWNLCENHLKELEKISYLKILGCHQLIKD